VGCTNGTTGNPKMNNPANVFVVGLSQAIHLDPKYPESRCDSRKEVMFPTKFPANSQSKFIGFKKRQRTLVSLLNNRE
jgi:hypothetical protein